MAVAVVRRLTTTLLLAWAALASIGAAPAEEREMLRAISDALTAMAYAASGLCLFAIVWAGFVLMAEGGEERAIRLFVSGKITEDHLDLQRKFITERLESLRAKLDDDRAREASGAEKRALVEAVLAWGEGGWRWPGPSWPPSSAGRCSNWSWSRS